MEHRLRRKHLKLNSETNASNEIHMNEKTKKKNQKKHIFSRSKKMENTKNEKQERGVTLKWEAPSFGQFLFWPIFPLFAGLYKSARVYFGFRPGPTRVTPPSRQDDGNVRAPALSRAVCVVVQVVVVGRLRWWLFYRQSCVSARTSPRPTSCGEGVGRPRRLNPSACT